MKIVSKTPITYNEMAAISKITPAMLCRPSTEYFCQEDDEGLEYSALVLSGAKIESVEVNFKGNEASDFFYLVLLSYDENDCTYNPVGPSKWFLTNSGKRWNMSFGVSKDLSRVQLFAS